ncbi:MAG: DNA-processing protein DprA [Legionellaceae bacterium]|nr:DNA-processing protein DprA [Legionellaceae bacterium]
MIDNSYYFLALNRISNIGPRTVAKCLVRWPNLNDMFRLSAQDLEHVGFSEKIARSISTFDFLQIDADLAWQEADSHTILTWSHPNYPELLKEIHDPPVVLYAKGDLSSLQQPKIAMVGTRKPSVNGSETAWQFAFDLASMGITIVSGLALGIDAQAHSGCLAAKGRTIAVMGTGIDCIYPRRHVTLASQICENGLLLSEFPLKSLPIAGHFPRRNRIISGLSSSTLVVEAAIRSGSLITARLALDQNRDVLAIPGSIHNPQARGCHQLLQQGAKLITSCKDILDEMDLDHYYVEKVVSNEVLACENNNLVKCIGFEVTSVDQMMMRSGLTVSDIMCGLAELELKSIVHAVPGGYMRCKL